MDEIERKKQKNLKQIKINKKKEPLLKEKINWRTTLDFG